MNRSKDCRPRIEEKIRVDDPGRYMRTLGRLARGTLEEGKGDDRKASDMEVKKRLVRRKTDRRRGEVA